LNRNQRKKSLNAKEKKVNDCSLKSEYYMVVINPLKHERTWGNIKLLLKIAEVEYILFHDETLEVVKIHPMSKHEYQNYYYNPN